MDWIFKEIDASGIVWPSEISSVQGKFGVNPVLVSPFSLRVSAATPKALFSEHQKQITVLSKAVP